MSIGTNSPAFQLWVRLVRSHQRIHGLVDSAFKAEGLPPLEWYDVFLELERIGEPLRARDLEQKLLLAQYNLSRLLDRLEKRRLILRRPDPDDGRSRLIEISEQGLALRRKMWPIYKREIERAVGGRLTAEETTELAGLLEPLAASDEAQSKAKAGSE
jgi:DNA-binding MarR family transcriptional regulator